MCDAILASGKEGGSVAEMAMDCDVCIDTLYEWAKVHEGFSEAFKKAQTLSEAFHAKRVRDGLCLPSSEFQGAANLKYMAQRFQDRWSEKQRLEHTGPDGGPLVIERRIVNASD